MTETAPATGGPIPSRGGGIGGPPRGGGMRGGRGMGNGGMGGMGGPPRGRGGFMPR